MEPVHQAPRGRAAGGFAAQVHDRPPGGRATTFTPSVTDVQPRRRLAWLGHLGVLGLFDGEHIHEIEELEQGRTRYVQRERFTGALVPFVGGILRKTEEGFRRMNAELKARAERSPSRP